MSTFPGAGELRRRAERAIGEAGSPDPVGAEEARAEAIHELQIHQAELEIQNEELRRVQAELQATHDSYLELFELAPVAYLTISRACGVTEANRAAADLLGAPPAAIVGRAFPAFVAKSDVVAFHRFWRTLFEHGTPQACALRLRGGEGEVVPVSLHASPGAVGQTRAHARVVILRLAELLEARATLVELPGPFRSVFESSVGGVMVLDDAGRIADANPFTCRYLGYSRAELRAMRLVDLIRPEDRAALELALERARQDPGGAMIDQEVGYDSRVGGRRWGHLLGSSVPRAAGGALDTVVLLQDITSRYQAEHEQARSEAQLQGLVETAPDAIVSTDAEGRIRSLNAAGEAMFGYSAHELLGVNVRLLLPSSDWEQPDELGRASEADAAPPLGRAREGVGMRRDGAEFPVEVALSEIELDGQRVVWAFIRDLSLSQRLQQRLQRALRLEAVSALTSGFAHDFNNLLLGLDGCATVALDQLEPGHPAGLYMGEIQRSARRGTETVRQLLGCGREPSALPAEGVALNAVVARSRRLLESLLGAGVKLTFDLTTQPSQVRADGPRLEQILLNLASNARDAMPEGGELLIETQPTQLEGDPDLPDGPYLELAVTDTGHGIDPQVAARLFEPFFTTKSAEQGSGLGLFCCRGIVRTWGGRIRVRSGPGGGTRVDVLLPRHPFGGAAPGPERPDSAAATTVLLVEDDRLVRLATRYYLEQAGYVVIESERGDEAVERARSYPGRIDVVLTDVTLPGCDGARVAQGIREFAPGVVVIFMSAHPRRELLDEGVVPSQSAVLVKPFSREELLAELRQHLERDDA